jgi:DNA polymerase I-like protein with 3'-5' exonuclease and polymerase domains
VFLRLKVIFARSGGAADIVMCAMLRIENDERLKTLGFRQVLQVHDEIILEVCDNGSKLFEGTIFAFNYLRFVK